MKGLSLRGLAAALWLAVAVVIAPGAASALLLGDSVTAILEDLTSPGGGTIFPTALVTNPRTVGAGNEFNAIQYTNTDANETSFWTLDITDTGFTLSGFCPGFNGCDFDGLRLTLDDLDFTPAGTVLSGIVQGATNTLPFDSESVTPGPPSSLVITFEAFSLATGADASTKEFAATFTVRTPQSTVPVPGSLLLMLVGGIALGAFAIRRTLR